MELKLEDLNLVGASYEAMLDHIFECHEELRRLRQLLIDYAAECLDYIPNLAVDEWGGAGPDCIFGQLAAANRKEPGVGQALPVRAVR